MNWSRSSSRAILEFLSRAVSLLNAMASRVRGLPAPRQTDPELGLSQLGLHLLRQGGDGDDSFKLPVQDPELPAES